MNNRGSIEIIVVFGIIALLASAALVVDFGMVAVKKIKLENALENAAISGAHFLVESESMARTKALEYLALNGEDASLATVTITDSSRKIEVSSSREVDYLIAKIFGINNSLVEGKATAIIGPISATSVGIRPLGVEKLAYAYGDQIVLKEDAGDGIYGNFGSIALGGTGGSVYTQNLLYGFNGEVKIGDLIPTEPGNKASAVNQLKTFLAGAPENFSNYTSNSTRLWTLPLIESYDPNGRENLKVVGFAKFFIEDIISRSGQAEITGRFVEFVDLGNVDPSIEITGLYGVKLIR